MLTAVAILLTCQLCGETIAGALDLPLPGPVLGLAVLTVLFVLRPTLYDRGAPTAPIILSHLSLLFVPAGVGVVASLDLLSAKVRPSRRFSWPARSWPTLRPTPSRRGSDATLWPTLADCRPDDSDRHYRRRHRDTADECHAHPRLARAGMRGWQRMTVIRDPNAAFEVIA